jgi:hypothetical protein
MMGRIGCVVLVGLVPLLGSCSRMERGIARELFAVRSILVAGLSAVWVVRSSVNCLNRQVEAMGQVVCLQVLESWTNRFIEEG